MATINLTPEQTSLDASALDRLIDLWLADCRSTLPAATVEGYADKVGYWRRWWRANGPACGYMLDESVAKQFNAWLDCEARTAKGTPLAYHTRRDAVRRLRQMWRWAHVRGYVERDYGQWWRAPVGSAPLRSAADVQAVAALMLAAGRTDAPLRNQAIIAVLAGTGLRRAECAALRAEDVRLDADGSGVIMVRSAKRVTGREVQGRIAALDAATGRYVRRWLDQLPGSGPLWPARQGGALTPQGIYKVVRAAILDAGLEGTIQGPHDLRRAFATTFARMRPGEGYAVFLSKQLGHARYRQTAEYTLLTADDVRSVLVSPLSLASGQ